MQSSRTRISKRGALAFAASVLTLGMVIAGCTSAVTTTSITNNIIPNTNTSTSPVGITDAVSNQVLATSLTLNSIILTDNTGKVTTNLLAAGPITFEAAHLDAVQEPLFIPSIPEDTYVSVTLTYSNAQVAYVDPTTGKIDLVTVTPSTTSQTITFPAPGITISNTTTSLLVDYLVAQSVTISGSTVTVAPEFDVTAVAIPPTPTNGTNGLQTHKGMVTAIGAGTSASTDDFTMINPSGTALTIYVNANTVFQYGNTTVECLGISCLPTLKVNALVEVDTITQNSTNSNSLPKGSLLATRVEVDDTGVTPKKLLLGPVTSVTPGNGTAATSFEMVLRQQVGGTSAADLETVDVTVGSATFILPPRFGAVVPTSIPAWATFSASTIFAGQHVGVITSNYSNSGSPATATAATVVLLPQTVGGTITAITHAGSYTIYTLTMPADHWLAKLTGQTTVKVYANNLVVIPLNTVTPSATNSVSMRFNGYLFNNGGTLSLLAVLQADPPGTPIVAGTPIGPTI